MRGIIERMSSRGRHRPPAHQGRRIAISAALTVVLVVVGYGVFQLLNVTTGITTSDALSQVTQAPSASRSATGSATSQTAKPDTNILIMGLDSRVDENGNPLPQDIYDALHAGDQSDGGKNANVLMLLHIPGDGSKATEISIPRDDYVDFPTTPYGESKGKIKEAYGLAYAQAMGKIANDDSLDQAAKEQKARDAGRAAEIQTVQEFLGVKVDHFLEVTMVAFYQLAQVVQPITVCVLEDTQDTYSGANFTAGQQQLDASQAVAFVRQRRDLHERYNFTDLDRERRQQAFIASLATQLKQAGTLANPVKLSQIIEVTKANTAIDSGLNMLDFVSEAKEMAGGNVTFYTLPVESFGKAPNGQDVNIVDVAKIRATVASLLSKQPTAESPTGTKTTAPSSSASSKASKTPSGTASSAPSVVTGSGSGSDPAPTDLTAITGGGIPCVK